MRILTLGILASGAALAADVTFNKDVLPVLQNRCQSCHRPGEAGPMPLLTYENARPWAKAIKTAVVTRKMPPWFADPAFGHFQNNPTLTQKEIDTLSAWADGGAIEGDSKDKPAPKTFTAGWQIKPDVVVGLPEPYLVPAKGVIELTSFTIPTGFTKDTWITSIEVRPGDPSIVHHVVISFRPHTENTKYGVPVFSEKERDDDGVQVARRPAQGTAAAAAQRGGAGAANLENVYVPGVPPEDYRLLGAAKLVPAGSDIVMQMHYTPNGKPTMDQTKIGFTLLEGEPKVRWATLSPVPRTDTDNFVIKANDGNSEHHVNVIFNQDTELVWFMPHLHLRGKDMSYKLVFPTGETQTVLSVPKYDFNWQLAYYQDKPIKIPKGTRLEVTGHYDNSANNKFNPNPNRDVWWGDQTWEEMFVPWFGVLLAPKDDPRKVITQVFE